MVNYVLASTLLLVNKAIHQYCLNSCPNFIHKIKDINFWNKERCYKFKNIKLNLYLCNNNKITDDLINKLKQNGVIIKR